GDRILPGYIRHHHTPVGTRISMLVSRGPTTSVDSSDPFSASGIGASMIVHSLSVMITASVALTTEDPARMNGITMSTGSPSAHAAANCEASVGRNPICMSYLPSTSSSEMTYAPLAPSPPIAVRPFAHFASIDVTEASGAPPTVARPPSIQNR